MAEVTSGRDLTVLVLQPEETEALTALLAGVLDDPTVRLPRNLISLAVSLGVE